MKIWKRITLVIVSLLVLAVVALLLFMRSLGLLREPVYDLTAPERPAFSKPAILVLHKTNGFIHKEAIPAGNQLLRDLASEEGWDIYITDNAATHNDKILNRFQLVIWNNTSGDILTEQQRGSFKTWLNQGGQFLGLHAAGGDVSYDWHWHPNVLIGAQFLSHTMNPQHQDANVFTVSDSSLTSHLPSPWRVEREEWYSFDRNPEATGSEILLQVDESSYQTKNNFIFEDATMPGSHPIAWRHHVGDGQVIYSSIGHRAATYSNPQYKTFIRNSMKLLINSSKTKITETVSD